jgi:hypothetical protein
LVFSIDEISDIENYETCSSNALTKFYKKKKKKNSSRQRILQERIQHVEDFARYNFDLP